MHLRVQGFMPYKLGHKELEIGGFFKERGRKIMWKQKVSNQYMFALDIHKIPKLWGEMGEQDATT